MSFQKQYMGLWLYVYTKHLNVQQHGRRYLLSKIQDGSQVKGSISPKLWHISSKFQRRTTAHSTVANSQEVYLGDSNNERQSEMATETGNTYISEAMEAPIKIPTTNLGYKTI